VRDAFLDRNALKLGECLAVRHTTLLRTTSTSPALKVHHAAPNTSR
jgi:hypothetical protein